MGVEKEADRLLLQAFTDVFAELITVIVSL